ncbi:MAG: MMPL family transporter [Candidatus Sericytochromatia bacterium]|nr:MMPL family transporter [Candidatus Sericytochromatia bacterium]
MAHGYNPFLARLGKLATRRPWLMIVGWIALLVAAVPTAGRLPAILEKGTDVISGSQAIAARKLLDREFDNPFVEPTLVCLTSTGTTAVDPPMRQAISAIARDVRLIPGVSRVAASTDAGADPRLTSADGHTAFVLVGFKAQPGDDSRILRDIRKTVAPIVRQQQTLDPTLQVATTGATAFRDDIIGRNSTDTAKAEQLVLIPVLVLLLFMFASLLAALLPVLLGVAAALTAMAGATLLASVVTLNTYVQTSVTMLGLALGIDYALFIVSRYRQELQSGEDPDTAIATAMGTAGWTVICSGLVVMVALGALIPSGVTELASVGMGGALVVGASIALSTTLLPALLHLLGPWLDWPKGLTSRILRRRQPTRWKAWGTWITRWRWPAAAVALGILLLMGSQTSRFKVGYPSGHWFPADLEAARGAGILLNMHRTGLTFPLLIVVKSRDGSQILSPDGVSALIQLSQRLHGDRRVSEVLSPVDIKPGLSATDYLNLYAWPDSALAMNPMLGDMFISRDRSAAFMQTIMADEVPFAGAMAFVGELRHHFGPDNPYEILIGGTPAINLDMNELQQAYAPWAIGFVFAATAVVLFVAFRSILIPLKAIVLNLLAVTAATGMIVVVFQEGYGAQWVGLHGALGSQPILMPTLLFCLTFGLSMDYEIFMLSRIREERAITGDEEGAIVSGLASTGGLITAAAAVMVLVFGAFVAVEMALVKMLGFGLAVAIALDATLIRGVLAPAALAIAGKWNWWPGDRKSLP